MTKRFLILAIFALTIFALNTQAQPGGGFKGKKQTQPTTEGEKPKPTGNNMSAAQKQNITKLKNDLNAIQSGSQVTDVQKEALKNDLMALCDGATKPDEAMVQKLANDLAEAM